MLGKKLLQLICGGILAVFFYLVLIGVYTRLSKDPIIFIALRVPVSAISPALPAEQLFGGGAHSFDNRFCIFLTVLVYLFGLILLSVFGPTFIDRSISYHIAFYAVDEGEIDIGEMEEVFSKEIFEKRIHDAIVSRFIVETGDGKYAPTWKAQLMTAVLKPLGELTGSLGTYSNMVDEIAASRRAAP